MWNSCLALCATILSRLSGWTWIFKEKSIKQVVAQWICVALEGPRNANNVSHVLPLSSQLRQRLLHPHLMFISQTKNWFSKSHKPPKHNFNKLPTQVLCAGRPCKSQDPGQLAAVPTTEWLIIQLVSFRATSASGPPRFIWCTYDNPVSNHWTGLVKMTSGEVRTYQVIPVYPIPIADDA